MNLPEGMERTDDKMPSAAQSALQFGSGCMPVVEEIYHNSQEH